VCTRLTSPRKSMSLHCFSIALTVDALTAPEFLFTIFMSFVLIALRLIDRTKMRTIILFVKCFDKIIMRINKSGVFGLYMKHKKTPLLARMQTGVSNFIP
jgi:hypothetical protein